MNVKGRKRSLPFLQSQECLKRMTMTGWCPAFLQYLEILKNSDRWIKQQQSRLYKIWEGCNKLDDANVRGIVGK
jgi:hypothetical protein